MMLEVPYLEMLITRRCSLHCDGCAVYSNYTFKNHTDFEESGESLRLWSKRIYPKTFRILGGEPTLHAQLPEYVELAYKLWPNTQRWVVTNGTHLYRHPDLPKILSSTNTKVLLSIHSDDKKYLRDLRENINLLRSWRTKNEFYFVGEDYRRFSRYYQGVGKGMRPFNDNNPEESYNGCGAKMCKNIGVGRLWKCPQIMLLRSTLERFNLLDHPAWQPYINYTGIGFDCTDKELVDLFTLRPEAICRMCPAKHDAYRKDISNIKFDTDAGRVEYTGQTYDYERVIRYLNNELVEI